MSSTVEGAGRRRDGALVADLAALLGVEVGLVQEQGELIAAVELAGVADEVVLDPADDLGLGGWALVLG